MIRAVLLAALVAGPAAAQGVPSGRAVVLWQVLWERVEGQGPQAILRFIAPDVAGDGAFEAMQADLDWLCETHGLPLAALPYARSETIVVTLMDRPIPRGVTDPDAAQFFGLYRVEDGRCVADLY